MPRSSVIFVPAHGEYINYIFARIARGFIPHIIPMLEALNGSYVLCRGLCGWYRDCPAG